MLKQFITYNAVGIVNTVVGFGLILFLMLLGVSPVLSNIVGYGVGAILSYYLNSKYTFDMKARSANQGVKFFAILFLAYGLNMLTLQWMLDSINPYIAQGMAAFVYSLSAFLMAKFFIFKNHEETVV